MNRKKTLLLIDDDRFFCDSVTALFAGENFRVVSFHTWAEARKWCKVNKFEVVLLDQKLPDVDGLEVCTKLIDMNDRIKIIFITAYPSLDHAIGALRLGAHDYLAKPLELEALQLAVLRAFRTDELERIEQFQKLQARQESANVKLIGFDDKRFGVRELIRLASANRSPVLITGETGTGKNVVAKNIHYLQHTQTVSFFSINCAALPENLIESELFGYEKGAFTGALESRKGIFETADGGTLFLDEIGELPPNLQAKLLGVLDDGMLRRLGGQTLRQVDVRVIGATNVDLEVAMHEQRFREDLFYRMDVLRIHLPPLRERRQDISELAHFFLERLAPDQGLSLPPSEVEALTAYSWPGNVRELRNIIERAIMLRTGSSLFPSRLLSRLHGQESPVGSSSQPSEKQNSEDLVSLSEVEKQHICRVLAACDNNHSQAARLLGIARTTLLRKINSHDLRPHVAD